MLTINPSSARKLSVSVVHARSLRRFAVNGLLAATLAIGAGMLTAPAQAQNALPNSAAGSSREVASNAAIDYKVLATQRTSTMEEELNEAAEQGFAFSAVMGGETAGSLGNETAVILSRTGGADSSARHAYKLLATNKTSTMEKELNQAGEEGYIIKGQTVFSTMFGGKEVVVILERDLNAPAQRIEYKLLATNKTSTMDKELNEAGAQGFELKDLSVAKTTFGGDELVSILMRVVE